VGGRGRCVRDGVAVTGGQAVGGIRVVGMDGGAAIFRRMKMGGIVVVVVRRLLTVGWLVYLYR